MYEPIEVKNLKLKEPPQYKIGDKIEGHAITKICGLVNGRQTYASNYVCKSED